MIKIIKEELNILKCISGKNSKSALYIVVIFSFIYFKFTNNGILLLIFLIRLIAFITLYLIQKLTKKNTKKYIRILN